MRRHLLEIAGLERLRMSLQGYGGAYWRQIGIIATCCSLMLSGCAATSGDQEGLRRPPEAAQQRPQRTSAQQPADPQFAADTVGERSSGQTNRARAGSRYGQAGNRSAVEQRMAGVVDRQDYITLDAAELQAASAEADEMSGQERSDASEEAARKDPTYPRLYREQPRLLAEAGIPVKDMTDIVAYGQTQDYLDQIALLFNEMAPMFSAPLGCTTPELIYREAMLPQTTVSRLPDGRLSVAGWLDQWKFDRCGEQALFNVFAGLSDGELVKITALPPGDSLADIQVMRVAIRTLGRGVAVKLKEDGIECDRKDLMIVDRTITDDTQVSAGRWSETWEVGGCGDRVYSIPLNFNAEIASGAVQVTTPLVR